MKSLPSRYAVAAALMAVSLGCNSKPDPEQVALKEAHAQVASLASKLHARTTDTGSYVRAKPEETKSTDPWGHRLVVTYSQGGVAESLEVRSWGPDGKEHTDDDIAQIRSLVNMKGMGRAVQEGSEKTAENIAKGAVRGAVEGAKESISGAKERLKSKLQEKLKTSKPEGD